MPTTRSGMEDYTCWICHLGRETVNLTFIPMLDISDILTLLAWGGILLFSDSGLTFPVALPWIRFQRQKCWEELPKWQRQPLVTSLLIFKCMFLLLHNYFRCIHVKWVWERLLLLATDSFSVVAGRLCYPFPFFFLWREWEDPHSNCFLKFPQCVSVKKKNYRMGKAWSNANAKWWNLTGSFNVHSFKMETVWSQNLAVA